MTPLIFRYLFVLAIAGLTNRGLAQFPVLPDTFEAEPSNGFTLRTWTGAIDDKFSDKRNWEPVGFPSSADSVVIPSGNISMDDLEIQLGALHILNGGTLRIYAPTILSIDGSLIIEENGRFEVRHDVKALTGDIHVHGRFEVDSSSKPKFTVLGKLNVYPDAEFRPREAKFEFKGDSTDVVILPPLEFFDLRVDTGSDFGTNGDIRITHELELNAVLLARPQDTITIVNGDTAAITGQGKIAAGTIVRTIDSAIAVGGGAYRFHYPGTTMRFFPQGKPPSHIEITLYPDAFPQNLDSTVMFKHYYDIHQTGGEDFRLELSLQYDPREAMAISPDNKFSIYRSPDYGITWFEIPATSVDTVNHIIRADNITGFSRYGFGRGTPTATDVAEKKEIVREFALTQNYPNPFNPTTTISYSVGRATDVMIKVYNVLGEEMATLMSERKEVGNYSITWNASNVPSGVYICKLVTQQHSISRKLMLLK